MALVVREGASANQIEGAVHQALGKLVTSRDLAELSQGLYLDNGIASRSSAVDLVPLQDAVLERFYTALASDDEVVAAQESFRGAGNQLVGVDDLSWMRKTGKDLARERLESTLSRVRNEMIDDDLLPARIALRDKGEALFQFIGTTMVGIAGGEALGAVVARVAPRLFSVDSAMAAADEAAGVLNNGQYINNPTARKLNDLVTDSGRIGGKTMNGRHMYVIDPDGQIVIGSRGGARMPHPTLIGGEDPQVLGAGIVDIRGGKIYSIDNASGHFKPGAGSLDAARAAFGKLPSSVFRKDFRGYLPYDAGAN